MNFIKTLLFWFLLGQFNPFYAQTNDRPTDWTFYKNFEGVNIYYKYIECYYNQGQDQMFMILKLENTTDELVEFNYQMELTYNGACKTCGEREYLFHAPLEANKTYEGDCVLGTKHGLKFFTKFINFPNKDELTSFKLTNLHIGPNLRNCNTALE